MNSHRPLIASLAVVLFGTSAFAPASNAAAPGPTYFDVSRDAGPHDVAAAREPGGAVYYTAQRTGKLGILDPKSGKVDEISLGPSSAPHGVIVGPDGAAWVTDGGQNAIVRVDPKTHAVRVWPIGEGRRMGQSQHADVRREGARVVYRADAATTAGSCPRPAT